MICRVARAAASDFADTVRNRNAIVEDVVEPAKPVWTGFDVEPRFEKRLIVAVALAEHDVGAH